MCTWRSPLDQRVPAVTGSGSSGVREIERDTGSSPTSTVLFSGRNASPLVTSMVTLPLGTAISDSTRRMEVMLLEAALGAHEGIVAMDPRIVGRVGAAVGSLNRDSRRLREGKPKTPHRPPESPLSRSKLERATADHFLDPDRGRAGAVRNVGDFASIGRPPRRGVVVVAVRERKTIAALRGDGPELVPLPAKVRGKDDPASVRRDLRAGPSSSSPRNESREPRRRAKLSSEKSRRCHGSFRDSRRTGSRSRRESRWGSARDRRRCSSTGKGGFPSRR